MTLIMLIGLAWLGCITLIVAICLAAARSDAGRSGVQEATPRPVTLTGEWELGELLSASQAAPEIEPERGPARRELELTAV